MLKKLLALVTVSVMILSMNTSVFAEETPDSESVVPGKVELSGEASIQSNFGNIVSIKESDIKKTGETINISKQRSGQSITNKYGVLSGTLSSANTWDYYLFSSNINFTSVSKIATNNSNYTMTLGYADYSTGKIDLTNYVVSANQIFSATFEKDGNYAWVIQSSNATYGNDYKLQYNMSVPDVSNVIYASSDLQKLY